MTNKLEITRELAERLLSCSWTVADPAFKELRALLAQPYYVVCSNGILCQDRSCIECGGNGSIDISSAAPVVERKEPATLDSARKIENLRGAFEQRFKLDIWPVMDWLRNAGLYAEQPAPVAVAHPFAEKVIKKLQRFEECASDSDADGVDIGRHWLDLLTQLGLLNRVQRSPALREITQQGEGCLDKVKELNQ